MELAVSFPQVGVRHKRCPAVSETCDVDHVKAAFLNLAIEVIISFTPVCVHLAQLLLERAAAEEQSLQVLSLTRKACFFSFDL
jgi:hypothetical protein